MIRKCFVLALTFFRCLFQEPFFTPTTIRQKIPSVLAKKGRDSAKDGREGKKSDLLGEKSKRSYFIDDRFFTLERERGESSYIKACQDNRSISQTFFSANGMSEKVIKSWGKPPRSQSTKIKLMGKPGKDSRPIFRRHHGARGEELMI